MLIQFVHLNEGETEKEEACMRTLKYAILGLLCRGALTGYDISKAFDKGLGNFWSASHSQIYPEMKRLLGEGLVEFSTVIQGEKLEKKLYTITSKGRDDFNQWILRDEPLEPTPKDTFKLRIYLSDAVGDSELLAHLHSQLGKRREKLAVLEGMLQENYHSQKDLTKLDKAQRGDYLVLKSAIMRETAYVEWLLWAIAFIEEPDKMPL